MARWSFEPGHTEAAFRARHMMVTWVRGLLKDIHGTLDFDLDDPLAATFEAEIDATAIWTGEADRDAHLRAADFLDVENHPKMTFAGRFVERVGDSQFRAVGELINRHDFGVSWQDHLPRGGVMVNNHIWLTLDVQAIHDEDLARLSADPV